MGKPFNPRVFKPAHKDTDNPPGQIRNDVTLSDYIDRKERTYNPQDLTVVKKKLTFDEWYKSKGLDFDLSYKAVLMDCWDASRENV